MLAGAHARHAVHGDRHRDRTLFERIESELSGYYLLGVESDPRDRDGKSHSIRVDVPRRGAIVRSRRQVLNAKSDRAAPRSPARGGGRPRSARRCCRRRCRCASRRSRCRVRSATRCSC